MEFNDINKELVIAKKAIFEALAELKKKKIKSAFTTIHSAL